jgi:uncharacterized membrane protein YdbT with pleckstrin-like domain
MMNGVIPVPFNCQVLQGNECHNSYCFIIQKLFLIIIIFKIMNVIIPIDFTYHNLEEDEKDNSYFLICHKIQDNE